MNELWHMFSPYISRIIAIAVVVIVVYILVKVLTKLASLILKGVEPSYTVRVVESIKIGLYVIAAIIVAAILAPETQVFAGLLFLIGLSLMFMFIDVLRNLGSEFYIRSKGIVRRGEWIEVDGVSIRVIDFDAVGILGETQKLEKVFIPYTKLLNSITINRVTPFGLLVRIFVDIPQTYGIDSARNSVSEALKRVEEDLATEPDVTYVGSKGGMLNFVAEFHIINYRKLTKILSVIEKEIKNRIPEAVIRI
ncbi:MAG: mechanosensitive ion channel family protein [Ignisphaera sp.]